MSELYRKGAKIGSGSTADFVRAIGDNGHIPKAGAIGLRNLINSGQLVGHDLDIAVEIMDDMTNAISNASSLYGKDRI